MFKNERQELFCSIGAEVCVSGVYLLQLLLCGEAQAVDRVCPAVCPLAKLLGGFGEGHVGGDGAVDDGLRPQRIKAQKSGRLLKKKIT